MYLLEIKEGLDSIAKAFEGMPNNKETREMLQFNIALYLIMIQIYDANINILSLNNGKWKVSIDD